MEREFYQNQQEFARLGELKKKLADMPKQKQCHRYRWTQTETTFDVEIPIHKPCDDEDLYLVVDKDQLQVAIKTDEPFGAITVGSIIASVRCSLMHDARCRYQADRHIIDCIRVDQRCMPHCCRKREHDLNGWSLSAIFTSAYYF